MSGGMTEQTIYAVAYARVSTDDHDQNPESQLVEIRKWATNHNRVILKEFSDKSTGTNTERDGLTDMVGYIQMNSLYIDRGKISEVIVLDADRLSRNMKDSNKVLDLFDYLGVRLVYVANDSLDLSTSEGYLINQIKSHAAQAYTDSHTLKIKAGIDRARAEGKHIGRPLKRSNDAIKPDMLIEFAKRGYSLRMLESVYKCNKNTLSRILQDCGRLEEFKEEYNKAKNYQRMMNPSIDH